MLASQLRKGHCDNDTERTVARWLLGNSGDWDNVADAAGINVQFIQDWVRSLPTMSELRKFLPELQPKAKDCNGEDTKWTQAELDAMIEALESTGRYDVQGRRW